MQLPHTHLTTANSTNSQLIEAILTSHTAHTNNTRLGETTPHFSQPYLLTADTQTGGRGQHGRRWQSPKGNVYLSLYIPTSVFSDKNFAYLNQRLDGRLSLCVGYQLSQMPQLAKIQKIGVKWVNDIGFYKNDIFQKLSGILIEPVTVENKMLGVVIGVGMNIAFAPTLTTQTQEGLNYQAVSLQDLIRENLNPHDFYQPISQTILQAIEQFNGFSETSNVAAFLQDFKNVDILSGKRLQLTLPTNGTIIGTAHGIDNAGCLQVLQDNGTITPIWTGTLQVL